MNCQRLGVDCSGYMSGPLNRSMRMKIIGKSPPNESLTEAGTPRLRLLESCKCCRSAKTKCSGESPSCGRCTEKKLECIYDIDHRRTRKDHTAQLKHRTLVPTATSTQTVNANNATDPPESTIQTSLPQTSTKRSNVNRSNLGEYSWYFFPVLLWFWRQC